MKSETQQNHSNAAAQAAQILTGDGTAMQAVIAKLTPRTRFAWALMNRVMWMEIPAGDALGELATSMDFDALARNFEADSEFGPLVKLVQIGEAVKAG